MKIGIGLAAASVVVLAGAAAAQTAPPAVDGVWQGQMKLRQDSLPVVIHLGPQVTGDSPAERVFGVPGKLEQAGEHYKVTLEDGVVFDGVLTKGGKLEGAYTRGELSVPLVLERQAEAKP